MRGNFIVFEGINGCGKGAQLSRLTDHVYDLDKSNSIFRTREPNDFDDNGRKARAMLSADEDPYSNNVEAVRLFAENRKTHNGIFVPMLDRGIDVFSDRYWYSNFAFQGAQGVPYEDIACENRILRVPDLTLLIDVPVNVALERLHDRDGVKRRKFDTSKKFLDKVRKNYLKLPDVLPELMGDESVIIINGNHSIEEVFDDIRGSYNSFLKMRNP